MKIGQNGIATIAIVAIVVIAVIVAGVSAAVLLAPTTPTGGLRLVFKDEGLPEVKHLQPTITEIQLQREGGEWITIWSDPNGTTLTLTADGAEIVLATVSLEAGTYVGVRLFVTTMGVEVDVNRDGDTLDTNVEVVVPIGTLPPPDEGMDELEQINVLTAQITDLTETLDALVAQLEEMGVPPPGEEPEPPSPPEGEEPPPEGEGPPPEGEEPPPEGEGPPPEGEEPTPPEQPELSPEAQALIEQIEEIRAQIEGLIAEINELTGGSEPPREEGGLVYTGKYLDEKFTEIFGIYINPPLETNIVYDGSGGNILFDFTLHPLKPRGQNISLKVSMSP